MALRNPTPGNSGCCQDQTNGNQRTKNPPPSPSASPPIPCPPSPCSLPPCPPPPPEAHPPLPPHDLPIEPDTVACAHPAARGSSQAGAPSLFTSACTTFPYVGPLSHTGATHTHTHTHTHTNKHTNTHNSNAKTPCKAGSNCWFRVFRARTWLREVSGDDSKKKKPRGISENPGIVGTKRSALNSPRCFSCPHHRLLPRDPMDD